MEKYKYLGKNEEEALNSALEELQLGKEDLFIEIEEQKGGLFKSKKTELTVIKKSDVIAFIKELILDITKSMGLDVKIETKVREKILNIVIYSDNNNILIGKNGRTMSSLTTIIRQAVFNELGFFYNFNLDVGEYKLKQQKNIEHLAVRIANDVARSKVEAKLDPMNSYERRIVHNILNGRKDIYTESIGEEPNRCVVIKAKDI